MVFLVWLKGMMLLKPALLLPGLYMLYMLSLPPGYRGLLYTGLKGGGARVVLVIGGIGGPEVRKVLAGCKVKMALWRNLLPYQISIVFSNTQWRRAPTCREGMKRECPVDSRSLEDCLHDEVVGAVDPERVVAKSLSEDAVSL